MDPVIDEVELMCDPNGLRQRVSLEVHLKNECEQSKAMRSEEIRQHDAMVEK